MYFSRASMHLAALSMVTMVCVVCVRNLCVCVICVCACVCVCAPAAFAILVITYVGAFYLAFFTPYLNLGWVYDNHLALLTASVLFSCALAVSVQ